MPLKDKYINPFTDFGFKKLFETAEIAKSTPTEREQYEDSLKYYQDLKNVTDKELTFRLLLIQLVLF